MPISRIEGIENALRILGAVGTLDTIEPDLKRGALRLEAGMKYYPPARTGSSYVRTGRYGQGWNTRFERTENTFVGTVGNNVRYAADVGSAEQQNPIHRRTGWPTDVQVARREEPGIVRNIEESLRRATR